jgi:hypothetical protein
MLSLLCAVIQAGQGLYELADGDTLGGWKASNCDNGNYGVPNATYGLSPSPCRCADPDGYEQQALLCRVCAVFVRLVAVLADIVGIGRHHPTLVQTYMLQGLPIRAGNQLGCHAIPHICVVLCEECRWFGRLCVREGVRECGGLREDEWHRPTLPKR